MGNYSNHPVADYLPIRACHKAPDGLVPVRRELHLGVLAGHQLGNERQVGDLSGGPAELKDDDERGEIDETHPLRENPTAAQTRVKDERERQQHADGS